MDDIVKSLKKELEDFIDSFSKEKLDEFKSTQCPAWFNLMGLEGGSGEQPLWDKCGIVFKSCKHFPNRKQCWDRWNKEKKLKQNNG